MPIVSFKDKSETFEIEENAILFDALDDAGEQLPHGCLAGSCGACKVEITSGAENLKAPSEIEKNTIEAIKQNYERMNGAGSAKDKIIRLSCRTRVLGDFEFTKLK
jgi:ferredoxin